VDLNAQQVQKIHLLYASQGSIKTNRVKSIANHVMLVGFALIMVMIQVGISALKVSFVSKERKPRLRALKGLMEMHKAILMNRCARLARLLNFARAKV